MVPPLPVHGEDRGLCVHRGAAPDAMPLAYAAFHQLHHALYTRYALIRTGDTDAAGRAVEAAFAELARTWTHVLGSARPAALAWDVLRWHVAAHTREERERVLQVRRGPASRRDDALLLQRQLGLAAQRAADLMGIDVCRLRALVKTA
jgi:hypothetical protein